MMSLFHDELKWHCNVLKAPYNSFPPSLLYYGKSVAFYQFSSLKVLTASSAIRASWATVSNWKYLYNFLDSHSFLSPDLPLLSLHHDNFSPLFWDSSPFAVHLFHASKGIVFGGALNLAKTISSVKKGFFHSYIFYLSVS